MLAQGLWPRIAFFELKISNILKSSGWGLEKSELPQKQKFYSCRCVSSRTVINSHAYLLCNQSRHAFRFVCI